MSKKNIDVSPPIENSVAAADTDQQQVPVRVVALCGVGILLCILVSVSPLLHLAGKTFLLSLRTNPFLLAWGSWLPYDLHLAQPQRASMIATNSIEFLVLIALSFGIYALCAVFLQRQPAGSHFTNVTRIIWIVAIVGGLIYVLTPAMLSRDIFVYVGYGRTIALHHANPYFVAPAAFPKDPLTSYDDWQYATAAYGPFWLAICSIMALVPGNSPLRYLVAFRLLSFASYLFNILLVTLILKKMGRSPRTVALGTLLYAWNPLVIEESCLGGHNDTIMVSLLLLGIWLSQRAEQQNFARPGRYLLPIIAFTLATLVKITALPLIALFLVLLARRAMLSSASTPSLRLEYIRSLNWKSALQKVILAGMVSGLIAVICYAPFWLGHSVHDIIQSFSAPPSARNSENSIMRAVHEWINAHGLPAQPSWAHTALNFFNQRIVWDRISYVFVAGTTIIGAVWLWLVPTTRTMVLAALLSLGALLLVTPWFFAWYGIWLVALAVVCLPTSIDRLGRALIALALIFSASAFVTYAAAVGGWSEWNWLAMAMPPILAFLVFLTWKNTTHVRLLANADTITL